MPSKAAGLFLTWLGLYLPQTGQQLQLWLCGPSSLAQSPWRQPCLSRQYTTSYANTVSDLLPLLQPMWVSSFPKSRSTSLLRLSAKIKGKIQICTTSTAHGLLMVACCSHKCDGWRWVSFHMALFPPFPNVCLIKITKINHPQSVFLADLLASKPEQGKKATGQQSLNSLRMNQSTRNGKHKDFLSNNQKKLSVCLSVCLYVSVCVCEWIYA